MAKMAERWSRLVVSPAARRSAHLTRSRSRSRSRRHWPCVCLISRAVTCRADRSEPILGTHAGRRGRRARVRRMSAFPCILSVPPLAACAGSQFGVRVCGTVQSFVLNPLAGLVGPDGQPTMVLVDENASNDDGKKKRRRKKGDDDSDSDDEDDGSKPWWQCWGAHDPWEDFSTEVQKLLTEPPKAAEKNPFKGEHKSELLYDMLVDATLKEKIKAQIKPMNARCGFPVVASCLHFPASCVAVQFSFSD
jgi:hypothetical protein